MELAGLETMSALEPGQYYQYLLMNECQQFDHHGIKVILVGVIQFSHRSANNISWLPSIQLV